VAAFDEHVHDALNRALDSLKGHVESDLAAFREELSRAAEDERIRLASQAEAAAAETDRRTERQLVQWREAAAKEAEEREREIDARVRQAEAREHDAEARELEADTRRQEAEARHQIAERTIEELRRSLEEAQQSAMRELENVQQMLTLVRGETETAQRQVDEHLQTIQGLEQRACQTDQALLDTARLPEALRQMDQAGSLGEVLDALAQFAGREAGRAVVFLLKGERLRDWKIVGFDHKPGSRIEILANESGPVGVAVQGDRGVSSGADLPSFADGVGPRYVVTLPVTVGGAVVAVLYVDGPEADNEGEPAWASRLDVLARYAGRILESITIRQAAGVGAVGVGRSAGSSSQVSGHPPAGGIQ
jgi:hypothetical protein